MVDPRKQMSFQKYHTVACCLGSVGKELSWGCVGWPLWISEKALPKDNSRYFLFIFLVIYITIITIFYFSYSMRWFFLNDLSYMDYGYGYGWILIFFTFTEWKWKLEFKFLNQSGNFLELLVKFHLGFLVFLFILFF